MQRSLPARVRTAGLILIAIAAAAFAAPLALPSAASADVLGTLAFTPATGTDILVPVARTSAGCPTSADGYNAMLTGPVFQEPYLIAITQDVNFSTTSGFPVQLAESFKDAATERGVVLVAGDYQVSVRCVDMFLQDVKAEFTGKITFTSPTEYVTSGSPSPSTSVSSSPSPSASVSTSPSPSATPSESPITSESPSATPTDASGTPASPTPSPVAGTTPSPVAGTTPSPVAGTLPVTGPPTMMLFLSGLVLLVAGIVLVSSADVVGR
jgi:hypothetical protein